MKKLMLILAIAALFIVGCSKQEESVAPPVVETPTAPVAPPAPTVPTVEEVAPEVPAKLLSDITCVNGTISLKVTNIGKAEVNVSKMTFMLNAAVDKTPNCEVDLLAVSASTTCKLDIVKAGKNSVVQIKLPSGESQLEKTCN